MQDDNTSSPHLPVRLYQHILSFMQFEAAGGLLLILAMVVAMVVENSPLSGVYQTLLMLEGELRVGSFSIGKPVVLWVNDLWMAIFFFLVGLEIKSELFDGHLADRSTLILPAIAALGGMVVPALIYYWFNKDDPAALFGWAIPMATDIAFALGVLSLLGDRVPVGAKIFLMTLAILDDLGAIIVIALFYTADLGVFSLSLAAFVVAVMITMNRLGVKNTMAYILVGLVLWICVLKSGVHATLAGVITALVIPWQHLKNSSEEPVNRLLDGLHPWVAFAILPAFAFVNTGISFNTLVMDQVFGGVPVGIALGLFVGKQLGVFGLSWLAVKLGWAKLPDGVSMLQLYGVAVLCGIGFTMSIFIGGLAFEHGGAGYGGADRLAILTASIISAVLGYLVFRMAGAKKIPTDTIQTKTAASS